MLTQLRFVPIGFGNAVCVNKIYMLMAPDTAQGQRVLKEAKATGMYIDASRRRPIKTLIIMDDNRVIGCAFSPQTTFNRVQNATETNMSEEPPETDDE